MRFALAVLLSLFVAGCATEIAPSQIATPAGAKVDRNLYRLGAGDRIRIEIFGEPDLTTEETLEATGTINYPLLGRIQVAGLTLKEVEQNLDARLRRGYLKNPSVRASIIQFRPIYVIGQVHHAGSYPYIEGLSVEKAIALAGGMTPIASSRKIFVLRESDMQNQREHAKLETPVYPGDTVVVEESLF